MEASRPYMPGYGITPAAGGRGLLAWDWAVERLTASHDYWIATVDPSGAPHVTPVWGVWHDERLWVSCAPQSRKARDLRADPRCAITTDGAAEPVVVEGSAEFVSAPAAIASFTQLVNAKYDTSYGEDFFTSNECVSIRPAWVFGLDSADFTGTPTRWRP